MPCAASRLESAAPPVTAKPSSMPSAAATSPATSATRREAGSDTHGGAGASRNISTVTPPTEDRSARDRIAATTSSKDDGEVARTSATRLARARYDVGPLARAQHPDVDSHVGPPAVECREVRRQSGRSHSSVDPTLGLDAGVGRSPAHLEHHVDDALAADDHPAVLSRTLQAQRHVVLGAKGLEQRARAGRAGRAGRLVRRAHERDAGVVVPAEGQQRDVEADLVTRFAARAEHPATVARVGGVVARCELDHAQQRVVAALTGTGRLLVIEGAAGAGKTTTLAAARELLEIQGHGLLVATPTLKAAQPGGSSNRPARSAPTRPTTPSSRSATPVRSGPFGVRSRW